LRTQDSGFDRISDRIYDVISICCRETWVKQCLTFDARRITLLLSTLGLREGTGAMADVIDFSAAKAGRQPVQNNEQGGRPDDDYLHDVYDAVGSLVADTLEMDLEHITQSCGRIAIEDMIRCGIAGLSKVLRDYPHQLYPAKGWDRGHLTIGTAPGYESRMRRLEEDRRKLRSLVNHYKSAYETAEKALTENERTGLTRRERFDYLMRRETPPDRKEG
jgi:hypothetical protein